MWQESFPTRISTKLRSNGRLVTKAAEAASGHLSTLEEIYPEAQKLLWMRGDCQATVPRRDPLGQW